MDGYRKFRRYNFNGGWYFDYPGNSKNDLGRELGGNCCSIRER